MFAGLDSGHYGRLATRRISPAVTVRRPTRLDVPP